MLQGMIRLVLLLGSLPTAAAESGGLEQAAGQGTPPPVDEIVVVSASRREEQLRNAPATMTVVHDEQVGRAPSQLVTDLMRGVPGVNVSQTSARDVNVTPRAATGTLSDSLLVLLDGRSIYQDFFGAVMWDFLPIGPTEIKQIEVLRSPGSAVWGANAMNGVVNVISKRPREMQGTSVGIRFGLFDRTPIDEPYDGGGVFSVDTTHAAAVGDRFAYKVSAGFLTQEPLLRPSGTIRGTGTPHPSFDNKGTTQPRLDARVDYDLADRRRSLTLAGGISATEGILHSGLGPLDVHRGSTFKYGRIVYTSGRLRVRGFVNALDGDARAVLLETDTGQDFDMRFENQAYDVEVSNLHLLRGRHLLSYGGNYRYNNFDLSLAPRGTTRNEGGAYAQDEIVLSERVRWIVGVRLDGFDVLSKAVVSPRTTVLVKPHPGHTMRLSYNRAFRAPSFLNSYLETSFRITEDVGPAGPFELEIAAVGNDQLKEEAITSYEAAYVLSLGRVTASAAAYLNLTADAIQFTQTGSYTSSAPPPGWPLPPAVLDELIEQGRGLPSELSYLNFDRITDRGFELAGEFRLNAAVSARTSYSWQDRPGARGVDPAELNVPPRHRFNAAVSAARGRYFGMVSGSFVDSAFWQDVFPAYAGSTAAYATLDGTLGVHSGDGLMTVTLRGTNLLNSRIQQHAFGDVIRRMMTGEIRFQF